MGIEWFRDLSITLMGFVTVVMLIFAAIIIYRLYRSITASLFQIQTLVKSANDTVSAIEGMVKTTSQNLNEAIAEVKDSIKAVSKGLGDTATRVQECIRPFVPVLAILQGVSHGIKTIREMFNKEK